MTVKTVRFNDTEEAALKKILKHYGTDFSTCVKILLFEKLEDLQDIKAVMRIKEGRPEDYGSAAEIDALFEKR
jgi:hypothetical protein